MSRRVAFKWSLAVADAFEAGVHCQPTVLVGSQLVAFLTRWNGIGVYLCQQEAVVEPYKAVRAVVHQRCGDPITSTIGKNM